MEQFLEHIQKAIIISVGDELLIGQVVNTNAAWMAARLNEEGIFVEKMLTIADDAEAIQDAVRSAMNQVDIVLMTGGLGPTKDDITKKTLCEYFGGELVENVQVKKHIYHLYAERSDLLNHLTATQWLVPNNATILANRVGSAPILLFREGKKKLFSLPGVPFEMEVGMREQVLPLLVKEKEGNITHRSLILSGIGESMLAEKLSSFEASLPSNMRLAYLPKNGLLRLRLSAYNIEEEDLLAQLGILQELVKDYFIGDGSQELEQLLGTLLKSCGGTIGTAESCTGGLLAHFLNKWSGSSLFYRGSVVAYDNEVKRDVLGVDSSLLERYGAVSEAVVRAMVCGACSLLRCDYGIATSGVAGPTGGTKEKPVGTVWIAWRTPTGVTAKCCHFMGGREQIVLRACNTAMVEMIKLIRNKK